MVHDIYIPYWKLFQVKSRLDKHFFEIQFPVAWMIATNYKVGFRNTSGLVSIRMWFLVGLRWLAKSQSAGFESLLREGNLRQNLIFSKPLINGKDGRYFEKCWSSWWWRILWSSLLPQGILEVDNEPTSIQSNRSNSLSWSSALH